MTNNILNDDLKFNIAGLVMDKDTIYAFIKKITPIYWYTRPITKFILKNYQKKNLICVEIGVDYGLNAKTLLKLLSIKKLYLVDPYHDELDSVSGDERFKSAQRFLKKYYDKIEFIRKTSMDAINDIPEDIDFLYIDGNHDYKNVKREIKSYYPKIKQGGIIGGHDFWASTSGVCKAVLEFVDDKNLKLYGKMTDWWIIKKTEDVNV